MTNWQNKNVTILGLGKSGYAAAKYLRHQGATVLLSEKGPLKDEQTAWSEELLHMGVDIEVGEHSQKAIGQADLIVTSPGIPPDSAVMQLAADLNKEVICDIELAYRETKIPIIAITGTNGKSTTTALISHILEFNGLHAPACGNIGSPVMDYISQPDNSRTVGARASAPVLPVYLVMEVSSFQLHYTKQFNPFIAVWLNLTPDHLEWHGNMEAYIEAKDKVFGKDGGTHAPPYSILNMDDPIVAARPIKSKLFPFSLNTSLKDKDPAAFLEDDWLCYRLEGKVHRVCAAKELPIIGRHNIENTLAAIAATVITGLSAQQIGNAIKQFKALAHRLEYIDTINGIACYNDSKATNPESSVKALQAFKEKIVLIAGGKDKGTDLTEFGENVRDKAAAVILLGAAKERFQEAFKKVGVNANKIHMVDSLAEAVDLGLKLKMGPLVLSPACASYDMFKNFEQRGDIFKELVLKKSALAATRAPRN